MTVTSSTKMLRDEKFMGLDSPTVLSALNDPDTTSFDIEELTAFMVEDVNPHSVVVDCTPSDQTAEQYEKWIRAGINVIAPNKQLGSGPLCGAIKRKNRTPFFSPQNAHKPF